MEHNLRTSLHKMGLLLKKRNDSKSLLILQEIDRIDQCKQTITEDRVAALMEDAAQLFPEEYASVPEAAALVVHVKAKREKEKRNAGTANG